jgi:protein-S-isoprenylcysteine O-methyltransferase Ste14
MLSAACLIGTVLLTSHLTASPALAVYALSFWHYLFYWWAYRHGAVQPAKFQRDAIVMKSVALTALASAYLAQSLPLPWHWHWISWISVLTIGAGFMLNLIAARALGHARTYYGWELGALPPQRVTSFPYSVVPHPMLTGNMLAFSGTLLHPGFREAWWPLAILHVALNGALILMETTVKPARRASVIFAAAVLAIIVFAIGIAVMSGWSTRSSIGWLPVAIVASASAAYGYAQRTAYVPAARPDTRNFDSSCNSHIGSQEVV